MRRKVNTRILVMAWACWLQRICLLARGGGLLEVDSNGNLPRARFCGPVANISDGMVTPGDDPGLGIEPDLSSMEMYRTV
jgi:L-alanine-DL-glutamate epimerase-like enolase superfamily enzyme